MLPLLQVEVETTPLLLMTKQGLPGEPRPETVRFATVAAPVTFSVLDTVVGELITTVEELTNKRSALLYCTLNALVDEPEILTMKFGSIAVSLNANEISRELVAVIVLPKS